MLGTWRFADASESDAELVFAETMSFSVVGTNRILLLRQLLLVSRTFRDAVLGALASAPRRYLRLNFRNAPFGSVADRFLSLAKHCHSCGGPTSSFPFEIDGTEVSSTATTITSKRFVLCNQCHSHLLHLRVVPRDYGRCIRLQACRGADYVDRRIFDPAHAVAARPDLKIGTTLCLFFSTENSPVLSDALAKLDSTLILKSSIESVAAADAALAEKKEDVYSIVSTVFYSKLAQRGIATKYTIPATLKALSTAAQWPMAEFYELLDLRVFSQCLESLATVNVNHPSVVTTVDRHVRNLVLSDQLGHDFVWMVRRYHFFVPLDQTLPFTAVADAIRGGWMAIRMLGSARYVWTGGRGAGQTLEVFHFAFKLVGFHTGPLRLACSLNVAETATGVDMKDLFEGEWFPVENPKAAESMFEEYTRYPRVSNRGIGLLLDAIAHKKGNSLHHDYLYGCDTRYRPKSRRWRLVGTIGRH